MPLVGLVDGSDTVSTSLGEDAWLLLQGAVRSRKSTLTLACGSPGHLRTSPLGTHFFAHHPGAGGCGLHGPETAEHLLAKKIIVEAAQAAGWVARPEVSGDGWVADVLAERGGVRIAFEVQWSRQTGDDYLLRQDRYAASGVRAAWFVRHEASVPAPTGRLPVFLLSAHGDTMTADLGGEVMPLSAAVALLLDGKVKYREYVSNGQPSQLTVDYHETACHKCTRPFLIWEVNGERITGPCGRSQSASLMTGPWATDRPEAAPAVRRAGGAVADRTGRRLANLQRRRTQMSGSTYMAFCCPHCGFTFGDFFVSQFLATRGEGETTATLHVDGPNRGLPNQHWCTDKGEGNCALPPPDWTASAAPESTASSAAGVSAAVTVALVSNSPGGITAREAVRRMFGGF